MPNETKSEFSTESLNNDTFYSGLFDVKHILCDKRRPKVKSFELVVQNLIDYKSEQKLAKVLANEILMAKKYPLNHWVESHSSQWTFEDNKRRSDGEKQMKLFSKWINSVSGLNYCQKRSFKARNNYTGIGSSRNRDRLKDETSLGHMKLGSIFGLKKDKSPSVESEKIKEYISEEHLNNEEKDRIKVSIV